MTLDCIASVFDQTKTPFEIIVVDNASTDGSAAAIAERYPADRYANVRLLAETENHGFAPAHEVALPFVTAPWLLLLNPDTVVLDSALDELLAFARSCPEARIWGGRTVYADGSLNTTSCWRRMSLWSVICRTTGLTGIFRNSEFFNPEAYGGWKRDSIRKVDIVTGCLLLIQTDFWNALGGFESRFTMYGEEADLCLRARARGARPMVTPKATIIHHGGASEPVAADRIVRVLRAKCELVQRHFHPLTRRLGREIYVLFPLTRRIATRVGGLLLQKQNLFDQSSVWAEVWRRRNEWRNGFSS